MPKSVTLAVDACGGDNAPHVVLDGVAQALAADECLSIMLCGPKSVVDTFAGAHERCIPVHAEEQIGMDEHPAEAVKSKRASSIVVGCKLVREGKADGFFSAGSTGACLVSATLDMGRIKGVKRPALAVIIPAYKKPTLLLDVGANAECKVEYLVQFAHMGSAYMQGVMGVETPSVGLLNIGEESTKGTPLMQEAYAHMAKRVAGFKGNCEGGALMQGDFDVVVTDGFTGNICLKTIEGASKLLFRLLKGALTDSAKAKMGAALVKGNLAKLKEEVSPDTYGGSPLLGVRGVCIVGHGASGAVAIKNGILTGCREVRGNVRALIEEAVQSR